MRVVTDQHVDVIDYIQRYPERRHTQAITEFMSEKLSRSGTYKIVDRLRSVHAIDQTNRLTLSAISVIGEAPYWPMANVIKEKILPPVEYRYVHIAARVALMSIEDRAKFLNEFRETIQLGPEHMQLVNQLYNGLAFCALMAGDVTNFTGMKGEINYEVQ